MDELLGEIEFEASPIPDGTMRRLDEVTIKRDGCIWRIDRNDADPFPSNPHAHNVESGTQTRPVDRRSLFSSAAHRH
jgi:hypothetical protein